MKLIFLIRKSISLSAAGLFVSACLVRTALPCHAAGIDAFFPIVRGAVSLEDAMQTDHAKQNMTDTVEQVFRMLRTFQNIK